jgi:hypothetical protein
MRRTASVGKIWVMVSLAALSAMAVPSRTEARTVGEIALVRLWAYAHPAGETDWTDVFARDPVAFGSSLRTAEDAAVHVHFEDGSDFRVGENSEVVIDSYVYDPVTGAGEMTAKLAKGVFRFISGRLREDRIRFVTPSATVGILGTDVWIEVLADGTTIVDVNEGRVSVVGNGGGDVVEIVPGENVYVDGGTGAAVKGPRVVSRDPGLNVDAGMKNGGPR